MAPSLVVGYGMAAVAVLFFGSNFVVTKQCVSRL